MATEIKFGTDGWRAIIADDFTFDNVRVVAQAIANYIKENGKENDGLVWGGPVSLRALRLTSPRVPAPTCQVLLCQGQPTGSHLLHPGTKGGGAVMVTMPQSRHLERADADLNHAGAASPEVIARLEEQIKAVQAGEGVKRAEWMSSLKRALSPTSIPNRLLRADWAPGGHQIDKKAGLHLVSDACCGVGAGYFSALLREAPPGSPTSARSCYLSSRDQPEPIPPNIGKLMEAVRREQSRPRHRHRR